MKSKILIMAICSIIAFSSFVMAQQDDTMMKKQDDKMMKKDTMMKPKMKH